MIAKGSAAALFGSAVLLTGCGQPALYQPPQPVFYYPAPEAARSAPFDDALAPPAAQANPSPPATPADNAPLPALAPEESGAGSSSTPDANCVGWWRICHFF